jgi:L-asparaginase II
MPNPILVEVVRGETVESRHRGALCIVDAEGRLVQSWGDVDTLMCPRSSLKPLQALALVESGAAEAFGATSEELALACASHAGESRHVEIAHAWLARLGLSARDLECGAHAPASIPAAEALIRAGVKPSALHNNCSGKHSGFLCLACHLKAPTRGYTAPTHPVQRRVLAAIAEITSFDVFAAPIVIDGCSAPNIFVPLRDLALGWARLGQPRGLRPALAAGAQRLVAAMKAHPDLVSGAGRPCTEFIQSLAGGAVAKVGAEGVYAACLPERGMGIALKIEDGAGRAASVALAAVLDALGAFRPEAAGTVARLKETAHAAWAGARTGTIRAAGDWARSLEGLRAGGV